MYKRLPVPEKIIDFIKEGSSFIIAGHDEPDGDCVGSQLGLSSLLNRLGKKTTLLQAGPWRRAEIMKYKSFFQETSFLETLPETDKENTRLIVVDCSSLERTGDIKTALAGFPAAFIDHHLTANSHPISYINPEAPASGSLVLALWEAFGEALPPEVAEYLLFSLCNDTGFFRHIGEGGAETLLDAHKLVAAGGNLKKIFAEISGGRSLNSRRLLGMVLSKAESFYDGRLIISTEELEETERFGKESRDSDMLYQLLQSVEGVEAVTVIRQDADEKCAVGLRSIEKIDVSKIAQRLGGGGHKNASGARVDGKIAAVKEKVLELFAEVF